MPSSNRRSSNSHLSTRTSANMPVHSSRSLDVPQRSFTFVLTNNPELLQQTRAFQIQTGQQIQPLISFQNGSLQNGTANNNNREEILNNLLRVELREATRHYLHRTRRSYPIYYVFDMTDIELQQL